MSKQSEIREQVTAKIVAALEHDLLPWRRMWSSGSGGQHFNALTGRAYRGVNVLLLSITAMPSTVSNPQLGQRSISGNRWAAVSIVALMMFCLGNGERLLPFTFPSRKRWRSPRTLRMRKRRRPSGF